MGYHRAGFDVTGVDNRPQPRYPFEFHLGDAMCWPLDGFDVIHASPPCQDHTRQYVAREHGTGWMLAAIRDRLMASGRPYVLENVPGAPMQPNLIICGCVIGLADLKRERWFETWPMLFDLRPPCYHSRPVISIAGTGTPTWTWRAYGHVGVARRREVMGIDWMTVKELSQAIPPAYTEYIGRQLLEQIPEPSPAAPGILL